MRFLLPGHLAPSAFARLQIVLWTLFFAACSPPAEQNPGVTAADISFRTALSKVWSAESNQALSEAFHVAAAGDVNGDGYGDVIVGAPQFDNGEDGEGRAWLYLGSVDGLSTGDMNGDGYADVAVSGFSDNAGVVRTYLGGGGGLENTSWSTRYGDFYSDFAFSLSAAGDMNGDGHADIIVGAPWDDTNGLAYVCFGSDDGLINGWTADFQTNARFGAAVAGAGDVNGDGFADALVGAENYTNGESNEGAAFLYLGSGGGLTTKPAWKTESDQQDARMHAASGAGDLDGNGYDDLIVGTEDWDNGQSNEGRIQIFLGNESGLSLTPSWELESDVEDAQLGYAVGAAGDVDGDGYDDVIAGYRGINSGDGRVIIYFGHGSTVVEALPWTADPTNAGGQFGSAVAGAGAVNGDGYSDVIVGARFYTNGELQEGAAFVYLGADGGPELVADWSAESDVVQSDFGISVAGAGDVNGDGFDDVIVGAPKVGDGTVFVYHGSPSGLSSTADWSYESDQPLVEFGVINAPTTLPMTTPMAMGSATATMSARERTTRKTRMAIWYPRA